MFIFLGAMCGIKYIYSEAKVIITAIYNKDSRKHQRDALKVTIAKRKLMQFKCDMLEKKINDLEKKYILHWNQWMKCMIQLKKKFANSYYAYSHYVIYICILFWGDGFLFFHSFCLNVFFCCIQCWLIP